MSAPRKVLLWLEPTWTQPDKATRLRRKRGEFSLDARSVAGGVRDGPSLAWAKPTTIRLGFRRSIRGPVRPPVGPRLSHAASSGDGIFGLPDLFVSRKKAERTKVARGPLSFITNPLRASFRSGYPGT